jgi:DNA polymerase-3 subunit epsilon
VKNEWFGLKTREIGQETGRVSSKLFFTHTGRIKLKPRTAFRLWKTLFSRPMYAIIDVETTGGSPSVDRVIEIAIFIHDGEKVTDSYSSLVNPKRGIDPYVTKLTGITNEMVADAPSFEEIHEKVLDLTHENIFVAHNVKFDFGMIRQEFKRIGIDFNRKQLDTVNLARKVIPGHNSYSLGNICDALNIQIADRHRARGDAEATVKLLEIILSKSTGQKYIEIEVNHGIDVEMLPPYLSKAEIEKLPEDAGVYFFRDEVGKIILLEGVKNIRKKVITYFSTPSDTPEKKRVYELLRSIDYELAGNELLAKLIAHRELKAHQPEFNKKVKVLPYTHAIFLTKDEQGFSQLKPHPINWTEGEAILKFSSKPAANKVLAKIIKENNLHAWFAMRSKLKETELDPKAQERFNLAMRKAAQRYLFKSPHFFLIAEGMHPDSKSVVWIEDNTYKGFGYFSPELTPATVENLKEVVKADEDDFETQKIIRAQLRKMKHAKIIAYNKEG